MSKNPMRIPWLATITALMEELNRHLDQPVDLNRSNKGPERKAFGRKILDEPPEEAPPEQPEISTRTAIAHLQRAQCELELAARWGSKLSDNHREIAIFSDDLDQLDRSEVRYPEWESRKGLARVIEKGGLFGPTLGQHIGQVIRGKSNLKRGYPYSHEESRERRWTVKRIATIEHLYGVSQQRALEMLCDGHGIDDPDGKEIDKSRKWVSRDRRKAKAQLNEGGLSERDKRHYTTILYGVRPDLPKGKLKDQPYPAALKALLTEAKH